MEQIILAGGMAYCQRLLDRQQVQVSVIGLAVPFLVGSHCQELARRIVTVTMFTIWAYLSAVPIICAFVRHSKIALTIQTMNIF